MADDETYRELQSRISSTETRGDAETVLVDINELPDDDPDRSALLEQLGVRLGHLGIDLTEE